MPEVSGDGGVILDRSVFLTSVAVEVSAADAAGTLWTLRYELAVVHRDRWYVRAIEPDPVAAGGRP